MKKFTRTITLALPASLLIGTSAAQEKILPYPIQQHRLENGLNVATV